MEYIICFMCGIVTGAAILYVAPRMGQKKQDKAPAETEEQSEERRAAIEKARREQKQWENMLRYNGEEQPNDD